MREGISSLGTVKNTVDRTFLTTILQYLIILPHPMFTMPREDAVPLERRSGWP